MKVRFAVEIWLEKDDHIGLLTVMLPNPLPEGLISRTELFNESLCSVWGYLTEDDLWRYKRTTIERESQEEVLEEIERLIAETTARLRTIVALPPYHLREVEL
jgi:hypothetical protein